MRPCTAQLPQPQHRVPTAPRMTAALVHPAKVKVEPALPAAAAAG